MSDDWTQAVQGAPEGVRLDIEVVPNAQSPGFPVGYNPWRKRLQARVAAPPEDGRANDELCKLVAAFLEIPSRDVEVVQGATSRQKTLLARGAELARAQRRVQEAWR